MSWELVIGLVLLAFAAEYIDSTLGMGYGTALTPLLMGLFGFHPLQIVPAILLAELVTGLGAGFTHHAVGNVELMPKTLKISRIIRGLRAYGMAETFNRGVPLHLKVALLIGSCSVLGTLFSVLIAVNLPTLYLKLYIGFLVAVIGVVILVTMNRTYPFSWRKVTFLGLIASFNKGISGGGYGPVVTGGQLLAGVEGKNAVGITSLAEAFTCLVGVVAYLISGKAVDWRLAPFLVVGGLLSVPLSAISVKLTAQRRMRVAIGVTTVLLGLYTLYKTFA
jgi:uncharacterized membrane protein YfcA